MEQEIRIELIRKIAEAIKHAFINKLGDLVIDLTNTLKIGFGNTLKDDLRWEYALNVLERNQFKVNGKVIIGVQCDNYVSLWKPKNNIKCYEL